MKKIIFPIVLAIIIVIVIVGGAVVGGIYLYRRSGLGDEISSIIPYDSGSEAEKPKEIVTELKSSLKEEFSAPKKTVFSWAMMPKLERGEDDGVNEEEVATEDLVEIDISGWKIVANDIAPDSDVYESVDEYFKTNNFEIDEYNWREATIRGTEGFQKNGVVCLVNMYTNTNMEKKTNPKADIDLENATSTMEISCGLLQ